MRGVDVTDLVVASFEGPAGAEDVGLADFNGGLVTEACLDGAFGFTTVPEAIESKRFWLSSP